MSSCLCFAVSSDVILGAYTVELIHVKGWQIRVSGWLMYSLCIFHSYVSWRVCFLDVRRILFHLFFLAVNIQVYCRNAWPLMCRDEYVSTWAQSRGYSQVTALYYLDKDSLSLRQSYSFFPPLYLSLLPLLFIHLSLLPQMTHRRPRVPPKSLFDRKREGKGIWREIKGVER